MSEAGPTSAEPHGTGRAMTRGKLLATGATGALAAYGLTASGAAARGMLSRADTVTLASYEENAGIPALAADTKLFTKTTGIDVKTHTFAHGPFQEQINS